METRCLLQTALLSVMPSVGSSHPLPMARIPCREFEVFESWTLLPLGWNWRSRTTCPQMGRTLKMGQLLSQAHKFFWPFNLTDSINEGLHRWQARIQNLRSGAYNLSPATWQLIF